MRIDVDDPDLSQEVVAVEVPTLPMMAPDLMGGVWLVTRAEAARIDRDGRTLVTLRLTPEERSDVR